MTKEVYSVKDVQELLGGVSYNFACRKIREIKTISDCLGIKGHIHRSDWDAYINRFNKKDSAEALSNRVAEQARGSIV